ncbi:hypothetical protein [Paenibacillus roseipurpureus]|uniref:Uncharacterized protein n=1 Tax=Paenibacillus roseopurpureus TaxID=2918901 RepID=A0AA96LTL3_9BACL|nr:hypothetical protein [Paenibacillus sp. MBLB1832]WNR45763.1 hypothetical protein MJB10_06585 [Paenibacillus sp. MBLB1832]
MYVRKTILAVMPVISLIASCLPLGTPAHAGVSRTWWVFMTPEDAVALYQSPGFHSIRTEARTFHLYGSAWPITPLDHASMWVYDMGIAQELLSATYMALKYGQYGGVPSSETDLYLKRMVSNWMDIIQAGPASMFTNNIPQQSSDLNGHEDPPLPFQAGWFEGDIALRSWLSGALQSYDAIRDDITSQEREVIDRWLGDVADQLWERTGALYPDLANNRSMSAAAQAHVIALVLQDRLRFQSYFDDPNRSMKQVFSQLNYPPNPSATPAFPDRPGFSKEMNDRDGLHGIDTVRHGLHALATLSYVAKHGGQSSWDVYANTTDTALRDGIFDTWYDIAGDLHQTFIDYAQSVEALQGLPTMTTPQILQAGVWDGFAYFQPRFMNIGSTYGVSKWTWPGTRMNHNIGAVTIRTGVEILRKERSRIANGITTAINPVPLSQWNTTQLSLNETMLTPQTRTFTFQAEVKPSSTSGISYIGLANDKASFGGKTVLKLRFNSNGKIEAFNGSAYAASNVSYSANTSYSIRLTVDVVNRNYSAYVTPSGGVEQTIGTDLSFDTSVPNVTSIKWWVYKNDGSRLDITVPRTSSSTSAVPYTPTAGLPSVTGIQIGFEPGEGYTVGNDVKGSPSAVGTKWSSDVANIFTIVNGIGNGGGAAAQSSLQAQANKSIYYKPVSNELGGQIGYPTSPISGQVQFSVDVRLDSDPATMESGMSWLLSFGRDSNGSLTGRAVRLEIADNGQLKYYSGSNSIKAKTASGTDYKLVKGSYVTLAGIIDYNTDQFTLSIGGITQNNGSWISTISSNLDEFGGIYFTQGGTSQYKQLSIDNLTLWKLP